MRKKEKITIKMNEISLNGEKKYSSIFWLEETIKNFTFIMINKIFHFVPVYKVLFILKRKKC